MTKQISNEWMSPIRATLAAGRIAAFGGAILVASGSLAQGRDLRRLESLLAPLFLAQQFGNLCEASSPSFLNETAGPRGSVNEYSEHAKYEVAQSLPLHESTTILRGAADLAREAAVQKLRELSQSQSSQQSPTLALLCEGPARRAIHAAIAAHDANHEQFLHDVQESLK